jgi:sugar lactone lactonase YvrE
VRRLLLALALAGLAGCGELNREGMLLVLDPAFQAETLLTEADGITSPDGLKSTEGLVLAPSGALLVGGGETGRIVLLGKDGGTTVLPLRIEKPESMAFDAAGNLYIADNQADILYVVTQDGRLHRAIANREGFSPETLHFAGGALLITDSRNGKLHRYAPEDGLATVAVLAGALGNVQGVTSDEAGNIYLSVQTDLKAKRGTILRLKRRQAA